MDTEFEETIEEEQDPAIKRPALISDPVVGRVGDQERYERQKATIERSRRLMQRGNAITANLRDGKTEQNQNNRVKDDTEDGFTKKSAGKNIPTESGQARAVGRGETAQTNQTKQSTTFQNKGGGASSQIVSKLRDKEQNPLQHEDELNFTSIFLLIGTALFFDVLQALCDLIVIDFGMIGVMVTMFAFMTFWFWFWTKGIKFNTKARKFSFFGASIIELIPWLNALPGWTLAVVVIIITTKGKKYVDLVPGGEKLLERTTKIGK